MILERAEIKTGINIQIEKKEDTLQVSKVYDTRVLGALTAVGILGLILPLRPKESDIEKRTLTEFPKPTVKTVLNGEFTDQISTWYADSFPFRENFVSMNSQFQRLYGLNNTEEIHGGIIVADDIPGRWRDEVYVEEG